MKHDIPFGNSNRENGPTFLDFPLFLGIFQWDEPTKRVPFTAEPEIPEILTKWKAPLISFLSIHCWFSHDVTKIRTTKLSILLRFYFHGVLEQLKINFQTNFRFQRVLGFVMGCAWISKLLRDAAFTWRPREWSFRIKKSDFFRGVLLSKQFKC